MQYIEVKREGDIGTMTIGVARVPVAGEKVSYHAHDPETFDLVPILYGVVADVEWHAEVASTLSTPELRAIVTIEALG